MNDNIPSILYEKRFYKVPIFSYSNIDNEHIEKRFSHLARLPYVKNPIVFLPDIHCKPHLETPSSSVILTHHHFCLALTSPSQNCGMSLVLTPIFEEDISSRFLGAFMAGLKTSVPLNNHTPVLSRKRCSKH